MKNQEVPKDWNNAEDLHDYKVENLDGTFSGRLVDKKGKHLCFSVYH